MTFVPKSQVVDGQQKFNLLTEGNAEHILIIKKIFSLPRVVWFSSFIS